MWVGVLVRGGGGGGEGVCRSEPIVRALLVAGERRLADTRCRKERERKGGGREGGREGRREGRWEGGREGGRQGGKEGRRESGR